jgi:hypothetical protein
MVLVVVERMVEVVIWTLLVEVGALLEAGVVVMVETGALLLTALDEAIDEALDEAVVVGVEVEVGGAWVEVVDME